MNDSSEVKLHFLDYWRVIKVRWSIILITFLLVMVTASVTLYFLPREYYSKVTIEVKQNEGLKIFNPQDYRGFNDLRFAPTQFQIMQSKEVLYPVIENLNLEERWMVGNQRLPKETVYFKLLKKLDMQEVRNTDLIEVGVYDTDARLAADIANTIAVVYQERRRATVEELLTRGLRQLEEEVKKQRKTVEEAAEQAAKIREEQGIVDLNPETFEAPETPEGRGVLMNQDKVDQLRMEVTKMSTQLEQIRKLKPEELMVALRMLEIEDPTVMKTLPQYQEAVAEEARLLNSGLGRNHPRIKALQAQTSVYAQQLQDAIATITTTLETRLKIAQGTLKGMEEKLANSREEVLRAKASSAEYIEAKSRYIQAKRVLESAESSLATQRMQAQITFSPAQIWAKAEPAAYPAKPNVPAYLVLAVLVGLMLGVGLAFFVEYLDTSVKTLEDVERFLGVPVLAVIPKGVQLLTRASGDSADAEAYRILRTNIEFNRKNPDANTITCISGGPGEGKSTTLHNLAYTCAKGGYNVLLVDADMRRPSQHRMLQMDHRRGLSDYLAGRLELEDVIVPTKFENLSFLPSGLLPEDAVGILNSQRMVDLIQKCRRQYDLVFFDSPPILGVSDGSVLASEVDITIMVVQHRRFPRSMLQRVKQAVINVGGNLLGVVLNNVDVKHDTGYQYYTNYTDYYGTRSNVKPRRRNEAAQQAVATPAESEEDHY